MKWSQDLAVNRIGVPEWVQAAGIRGRGYPSDYLDIDLKSSEWVQACVNEQGRIEKVPLKLPDELRYSPRPSSPPGIDRPNACWKRPRRMLRCRGLPSTRSACATCSTTISFPGDAHKLSQYFAGQKFDLICSSTVFEHFAMTWLVAVEIAKLLNVGGFVFVETHLSHASHERPWHFFQFSDMALRVLFSLALGIECMEAGASDPMVGKFSSLADPYLRFQRISGLYCHSEFLGRKTHDVADFDWGSIDLEHVVEGKKYLARKHQAA